MNTLSLQKMAGNQMSSNIEAILENLAVGQDYEVQLTICHPEGGKGVILMTGTIRKEHTKEVKYYLKRSTGYDNEDTVENTPYFKYFFYMDSRKTAELFLQGGELYMLHVGSKRPVKVGCSISIQAAGGRATSKSFLF